MDRESCSEDDEVGSLVDFITGDEAGDVSARDANDEEMNVEGDSRCGVHHSNMLPDGARRPRRQTKRLVQELIDTDADLQKLLVNDVGDDELTLALEDENFDDNDKVSDEDESDADSEEDGDYEEEKEGGEEEDEEEDDDDEGDESEDCEE